MASTLRDESIRQFILNDGKAKSIANGISDVINKCKLLGSITTMLPDTTSVNFRKVWNCGKVSKTIYPQRPPDTRIYQLPLPFPRQNTMLSNNNNNLFILS